MKFNTPLEQFEIVVLQPINLFGLIDLSFTNTSFYLLLTTVTILFFFIGSLRQATLVPSFWQSIAELFYLFILEMVKGQAGIRAISFFPFAFLLFNFVLFSNLLGLFPFGFTTTGQLVITFTIAFSINLGLLVMGFAYHGVGFLKLFVPNEAPLALIPLIVIIEVVSYALRTFSLSIRLFANMMAGHTLLNILSSFIIAFFKTNLWFLGVLPFALVFAVVGLEFGIAFLQAYVFTILVCIYLNDSLNLH
jgi:F-type H+-transporting ATPase subunit a